jgi:hypothetical protein
MWLHDEANLVFGAFYGGDRRFVRDEQDGATLLNPDSSRHYVTEFMRQEVEATGNKLQDPWPWMQANIPVA